MKEAVTKVLRRNRILCGKMYITYDTRRWKREGNFPGGSWIKLACPDYHPRRQIPRQLPKPEFIPTRLVRTSDMTVVSGSSVNEGYCALSYSWNQSGGMVEDKSTGNTNRIDEGKHRIIFPVRTLRKKPRGRKRIRRKVKFVKFEGIIQQVCKDFGIKYIWYDQLCIPQDDPEAKHQEIHQMHQIYSDAYCTVALLPEVKTRQLQDNRLYRYADYSIQHLEWLKRLWTLEEGLLSRRLLFVGQDVHFWWYAERMNILSPLRELSKGPLHSNRNRWNACNTLHHAHQRISRKDHDRVFALASIFPDIMSKINVDYKQSPYDLMVQFYGLLAKKDLSILCFGNGRNTKSMVQGYDLPSWTGAAGIHRKNYSYTPNSNSVDVHVDGKSMHVTCTGLTSKKPTAIGGEDPSLWTFDDIPPKPEGPTNKPADWQLAVDIKLPGHSDSRKTAILFLHIRISNKNRTVVINARTQLLSLFVPLKKENLYWCNLFDQLSSSRTEFFLSLTEGEDDHPTAGEEGEYAILTGIKFNYRGRDWESFPGFERHRFECFPVIRRDGEQYKAVGTCEILNPEYLFADYTAPPKKTYIIQ